MSPSINGDSDSPLPYNGTCSTPGSLTQAPCQQPASLPLCARLPFSRPPVSLPPRVAHAFEKATFEPVGRLYV